MPPARWLRTCPYKQRSGQMPCLFPPFPFTEPAHLDLGFFSNSLLAADSGLIRIFTSSRSIHWFFSSKSTISILAHRPLNTRFILLTGVAELPAIPLTELSVTEEGGAEKPEVMEEEHKYTTGALATGRRTKSQYGRLQLRLYPIN